MKEPSQDHAFAVEGRAFEWIEPEAVSALGKALSGLEYIRAMATGKLPEAPMMRVMGIQIAEVLDGEVVLRCTPSSYHYNPIGFVHGGLAATLLDSATGLAVYSKLAAGVPWTTVDLRIDYLRPMSRITGEVRCTGRVIRLGRRIGLADGELCDDSGKLIARGTATCIVLGGSN
jgi:uncharacterized protein (TIGR00369 family)